MAASFVLACLFFVRFCVIRAEFNYSECPAPWETQTEYVQNNFDPNYWTGIYYEIAYHDYTQNPACPDQACMTSNKSYNASYNLIEDHFTIDCTKDRKVYTYRFSLAATETRGYFNATVDQGGAILHDSYFPDTVVATSNTTKANPVNGNKVQYEWMIEFQCKTKKELGEEFVYYIGINFYCMYSNPPPEMVQEMIQTGYQQGLGVYIEKDEGLSYGNFTNCTYPWS
mmetsp:Transcript_74910/g.119131  ORF Transcript_74910/g.119131 Transcript_74910/m.119131 type:complete len:227 (-) Transcript_74910:20-700(-)